MKKVNWKTIINFLITVLTAVASSFCVQNCQKKGGCHDTETS